MDVTEFNEAVLQAIDEHSGQSSSRSAGNLPENDGELVLT